MDEQEIKTRLREWVVNRSKQPVKLEDVRDDTPVIDSGLLSSLDIVEFVLYVETLRGDEIDIEDLDPAAFADTNSMYQAFFANLT